VLITAGCKDRDIVNLVMSVNHARFDPARDIMISIASGSGRLWPPNLPVPNLSVHENKNMLLLPLNHCLCFAGSR